MIVRSLVLFAGLLAVSTHADAHHPACFCSRIDKENLRCVGSFTDGSGAAGFKLDVMGYDGRLLISGRLGSNSTFVFRRPEREFYILMDGGPGQVVEIDHTMVR